MEPVDPTRLKEVYVVYTRVVRIEKMHKQIYLRGVGANAEFVNSFLGWYATFANSYEALHLGMEQPQLKVGDNIKISFEKVDDE